MTIRLATRSDADAIAAMLARLAEETGDGDRFASTPATLCSHGLRPGALFEALIAQSGPEATGFALIFRHYSTTRGQPGVYVQDLWTAPETRRAGLGAALLAASIRHARASWGAAYLKLTTHGHNAAARMFYARLGLEAHPEDVPMTLEGRAFEALGQVSEVRA